MLEHADRRDFVVRPVFRQFAVIAQLDANALAQPLVVDQFLDMLMLIFRQRDAGGVDAVMLGRPEQQPAPAGADVQEALARLKQQLAADVVQLGFLRLCQRHFAGEVIGAGIDAARVQPKCIKSI